MSLGVNRINPTGLSPIEMPFPDIRGDSRHYVREGRTQPENGGCSSVLSQLLSVLRDVMVRCVFINAKSKIPPPPPNTRTQVSSGMVKWTPVH